MFRRYWIAALALGLALTDPTWGQENQQTEPEVQPTYAPEGVPDNENAAEPNGAIAPECIGHETEPSGDNSAKPHQEAEPPPSVWDVIVRGAARDIVDLLALAISASAALLLLWTLRVTRIVGKNQTRGFVRLEKASYSLINDIISVNIEINNIGKTPLMAVKIDLSLHVPKIIPAEDKVTAFFLGGPSDKLILASKSVDVGMTDVNRPIKVPIRFDDYNTEGVEPKWYSGRDWIIKGTVVETDIFNESFAYDFECSPDNPTVETRPDITIRQGEMTISKIENRRKKR
jgi:ribosomal protein S8E